MTIYLVRTQDGYEKEFRSIKAARKAAKNEVQIGNRGCSLCGTPVWAGDTNYAAWEAYTDRDEDDGPIAVIDVLAKGIEGAAA